MRTRRFIFASPILLMLTVLMYLSSCRLADIRTPQLKEEGITQSAEDKGRALLQEVWTAQGFAKAKQHETYTIVGRDHWKGMMGKMGNLWPDNDKPMVLRYVTGTFDAQVEFLEGEAKGKKAGLQSWNYYEQEPGQAINFDVELNERIEFGLAAFQYFTELPDRLREVPTVVYAGEKVVENQTYDLIFASWDQAEPTQDYDQYLMYVNRETKLLDFCSYSIRDNYLPGAKGLYGTIRFTDYRNIEGVEIPFIQEVYLNGPGTFGNYVHRLTITDFSFDEFDKAELYPDAAIQPVGDDKPQS